MSGPYTNSSAKVTNSSSVTKTELPRTAPEKTVDLTLLFLNDNKHLVAPPTAEDEAKLKKKLYLWVVLLMMLYIDKSTLSYASILGLFEETGINSSQYNNLNTMFYVGYLVAQWPATYALQRLPFGKVIATIMFSWSVIVYLHCVANNYAGLIVLRLLLGAVESVVIPALEVTLSMFFTKEEHATLQPIFFSCCLGSPIPAGFIAYGLLHTQSHVLPWKLFMITTATMTLPLSVYCWFLYPNNPSEARFLTLSEKVWTIQRVYQANRASIEQKTFKKEQFLETLRDPISWLFAIQCFTNQIANNLSYQQNLLYVSLGVSNLGSTLVSAAGGGFSVFCAIIATYLLHRFPGYNAHWAAFWFLPALVGGIGMISLDWDNKLGLLACLVLAGSTFGISYIIALGWTISSASGYTKKLTRNAMFMIGYSVANIISPQIWVARDAPRYYPAWGVQIGVSWIGTPVLLFDIRLILARRNKQRKVWIEEQSALGNYGAGIIKLQKGSNGVEQVVETDIAGLDVTDLQNSYFVYPL